MAELSNVLNGIQSGSTKKVKGNHTLSGNISLSGNDWTIEGPATVNVREDVNIELSGRGWEFSGIRFDVSPDANVQLHPSGADWTVHNLAWDGPNGSRQYLFHPQVRSGSSATVEECWWGGGLHRNWNESAVKVIDGMNGDLTFDRCYFRQNGCYAIPTAFPAEGRVHFKRSYFENCYHGHIRTGSANGTCNVEDCVIVIDDKSALREAHGSKFTRGVWSFWGHTKVKDTDITVKPGMPAIAVTSSSRHGNASVEVVGGNIEAPESKKAGNNVEMVSVGTSASQSPPSGVPKSAGQAYTGKIKDGNKPTDDGWIGKEPSGNTTKKSGLGPLIATGIATGSYYIYKRTGR